MTNTSLALIHGLNESPAFQAALNDFIAAEVEYRIGSLRSQVRQNQVVDAALIEGEITALEDLPTLFDKWARKYQPTS